MEQHDEYHGIGGYVHAGDHLTVDLGKLWESVDNIERAHDDISFAEIGLALTFNWTATVIALALENVATLRAIINEANEAS